MDEKNLPSVFDDATVVSLRPGDVVLFRSKVFHVKQREAVLAMLNEVFPHNESILLEDGQDIAVLRPEPGVLMRIWRTFTDQFKGPRYG